MIGYPADTQGWIFLRNDGKLEITRHAWFDTRNYIERSHAIGVSGSDARGFVEITKGTVGMPLGGTDSHIREQVRKYDEDIIACSEPPEDSISNRLRSRVKSQRTELSKMQSSRVIPCNGNKIFIRQKEVNQKQDIKSTSHTKLLMT